MDGRVLVLGGEDGKTALSTAELYDPSTGRFSTAGPIGTARMGPAAALFADGRVIVPCGSPDTGPAKTVDLLDPMTGRFDATGPLSAAESDCSAVALRDGRILVVGSGTPEPVDALDPTRPLVATP